MWNPSLIKDIVLLEKIQHRATKLIPEISHLSYHYMWTLPIHQGDSLKWALKFLLKHTTFYQNFKISLIWIKNFPIYFWKTSMKWIENLPDALLKLITCMMTRLRYLNRTNLELRGHCHRGDLIETCKILKGIEGIPINSLFSLNSSVTRGNSLKLNKSGSKLNTRRNFFGQHIVNAWNLLPEKVLACDTVNGFMNAIDRHFREIHGVSMTRSLNP